MTLAHQPLAETTPTMTTSSAEFLALADEARSLADRHSRFDACAAFVNRLVVPLTFGLVSSTTLDERSAHTAAISDEWLAAVAAVPTISAVGLRFLVEALEWRGSVSVAQARRFVEIESRAIDSLRTVGEVQAGLQLPGAALLLARAEREITSSIQ